MVERVAPRMAERSEVGALPLDARENHQLGRLVLHATLDVKGPPVQDEASLQEEYDTSETKERSRPKPSRCRSPRSPRATSNGNRRHGLGLANKRGQAPTVAHPRRVQGVGVSYRQPVRAQRQPSLHQRGHAEHRSLASSPDSRSRRASDAQDDAREFRRSEASSLHGACRPTAVRS